MLDFFNKSLGKFQDTRIRVDNGLEAIGVAADEKVSEEEINKLFDEN